MRTAKRGAGQAEGVVDALFERARIEPPASVYAVARACGLRFEGQLGRSDGLVGDVIRYDVRVSDEWRDAFFARCLAQFGLRMCAMPETPEIVESVARALLSGA